MRIIFVFAFVVLAHSLAEADQPPSIEGQLVVLSDAPAATFNKSGWGYSNTSNPILLTPDYLTNAMIGVSRLAKGTIILRGSAVVPEDLNIESIRSALAERLAGKPALSIREQIIGVRHVVTATYSEPPKESLEYAFEFNGYLIHVLLTAKAGDYLEQGKKVVFAVVESFKAP